MFPIKSFIASISKIYCFLYLAPIKLSEEVHLQVKRGRYRWYFLVIIAAQSLLLFPVNLVVFLCFDTQRQFLFYIGEFVGILGILFIPVLFIPGVKKDTTEGLRLQERREHLLRGASRIMLFAHIGGFICLVLGEPLWERTTFILAAANGFFISNAITLMTVMLAVDRLADAQVPEKKQSLLIDAITNRKAYVILYLIMAGVFLVVNGVFFYIQESVNDNWWSLFSMNTFSTLLFYTLLGMALGSWISIGRILAPVIYLLNQEITLKHDELGVLGHRLLEKYLDRLTVSKEYKNYCSQAAYFLKNSPQIDYVESHFAAWVRKPPGELLEKLAVLLQCRVSEVGVIVQHLESLRKRAKDEKWAERILPTIRLYNSILERPYFYLAYQFSQRYFKSDAYPKPLKPWINLLPENYSSKSVWKKEFERITHQAHRTRDAGQQVQRDDSPFGILLEDRFEAFLKKEANSYFSEMDVSSLGVDWKQETYYLDEGRCNMEVALVWTSGERSIRINNIDISFIPNSVKRDLSRSDAKQWEGLTVDNRYPLTLSFPVISETTRQYSRLSLTVTYNVNLSTRGKTKARRFTQEFNHEFLFLEKRPFQTITPNPYNRFPIKTAAALFGRDEILKELVDTLNTMPSPGYVLLMGERRIGKTSLLYVLRDKFHNKGIKAVYFDLHSLHDMPDNPNIHLLASLINAYTAEYKTAPIFPENVRKFDEYFRDQRVIFLLDEFDAYLSKLTAKDKAFWEARPFQQNHLTFLFSTPLSMLRGLTIDLKNVLFGEHSFVLKPLKLNSIRELVQLPVEGILDYEPGAINEIVAMTGGFPIYVQAVCQKLVDYLNKKQSTSLVTRELLRECLSHQSSSIPLLMTSYVHILSKDEIRLLRILQERNNRIGINEVFDLGLSHASRSLQERYLITKYDEDYFFCNSTFFLDQELLNTWREK